MNRTAPDRPSVWARSSSAPVTVRLLLRALDILEPQADLDCVELKLSRSSDRSLHTFMREDVLEVILSALSVGQQPCESEGVEEVVSLASLEDEQLCMTCFKTPLVTRALVDSELCDAVQTVMSLNLFNFDIDQEKFEHFISTASAEDMTQMLFAALSHLVNRVLEFNVTDLPAKPSYCEAIAEMMGQHQRHIFEFVRRFTSGVPAQKLRILTETLHTSDEEHGCDDVLVVLDSLLFPTVDLGRADTTAAESENSTLAATSSRDDQMTGLSLQFTYAPETYNGRRACVVPAWVAAAIGHLTPEQLLSCVHKNLDPQAMDTAVRLYSTDPSSIYSSLDTCVEAACALQRA